RSSSHGGRVSGGESLQRHDCSIAATRSLAGDRSIVRFQLNAGEDSLARADWRTVDRAKAGKARGSSRQGCAAGFLGAVVWSMPVYASEFCALAEHFQGQGVRDPGRDQVLWTRRRASTERERRAGLPSRVQEAKCIAVRVRGFRFEHERI